MVVYSNVHYKELQKAIDNAKQEITLDWNLKTRNSFQQLIEFDLFFFSEQTDIPHTSKRII